MNSIIYDAVEGNNTLVRRPLRLTLQTVTALVVDQDGESRQERLLLPAGTLEDILRVAYGQIGLELVAIDWLPGETVDAEVDIGVWADSIVSQSPSNTIERKQS